MVNKMAGWKDISEIWNTIQEFDLRPLREAALLPIRMIIVGSPGSGRHALADALRHDPTLPVEATQTPVRVLTWDETGVLPEADLVLILSQTEPANIALAQSLLTRCHHAGLHSVLICWLPNAEASEKVLAPAEMPLNALVGSLEDATFLLKHFVPTVLAQLPEARHVALGRQFPLFRTAIARELIDDTCLANATYAFSTGLAEAVPVLTLPLNVADMVVLTKSQAFLAYKLGLLLGFSTQWQDYLKEFGSVLGSGFLMRQMARQLIGLIPGWGIVPKVAVAYAGSYVVGYTILQWYFAGRTIRKEKLKNLYRQAVLEGKLIAYRIIEKTPRIKLPSRPVKSLPAKIVDAQGASKPPRLKLGWRRKPPHQTCPACAKMNSPEAVFCQYCGAALKAPLILDENSSNDQ
jgi:uncharacterized protein (DUF697 family)